ncbi:SDR family NAD(P)-dependent oxidoreductase [Brevundimonas lenta]|uniref:NAD(P)-dependent dehydrogenase (Short-subunit alcohol dehydrogenase family) n=1 Tax=Brevundimonas lenta TaxID=424796 RepID=A0A7W6JEV0_9CAUL|nr:SDR family NAD(P)-dependent oxidoreductase [Brevundimonas lenta]MBB4082858.1 NAD(P)-dependent dehydrogenase (short-subunit alcohol dehydrogenase family) [Brevundimonas lenta]
MRIDLSDRVAIVTGAGGGLGAAHAIALGRRGARVVVADMNAEAAAAVSDQIVAAGGEALACGVSVTDQAGVQAMCDEVMARWGRIDILINNAGVLRDRTFAKMDLDDFRLVLDVHLMGSVNCTKAVWEIMRAQNYGRIVFTTSSSGLYGSFGQANYSAAKMGLVGLMQTLALEGERYGIRVNCLAPSAATGMTNDLYSPELLAGLDASLVSPAVVVLASDQAPNRAVLLAGAGSFEQAHVTMTRGVFLDAGDATAEALLDRLDEVAHREGESIPARGEEQHRYEMGVRAAQRVDA